MTDPDRFLALLEQARQAVAVVRRYQQTVARERLVGDVDTQNMVLFAIYRATQACIDLGQHTIAERALPVPSAYREVFRVLGEAGIVGRELAQRLEGWAGMRNLIAHHYGSVDFDLIADALYGDVAELDDFITAIAKQLVESPPS